MRLVRFGTLALAILVGVLCGSARAAFAAPTDPCSLLTDAQVNTALGVTATSKATGKICRWATPGGRGGVSPAVVLTMQDAKAFDFAKAPSTSPNLTKTPVTGVGDDAVFNTIGSVTATLTVKKGDTYFEVHVYGFPLEQTRTLEKTLAQNAVAKLK
jgi:hypothetical protein